MLPGPPTSYAVTVDLQAITLTWVNGAGATSVVHEFSKDGVNFEVRDTVPATDTELFCSMPEPDTLYHLRAKSVNEDGESDYTPVIQVTTGHYDP
jgi:hypothetical protein